MKQLKSTTLILMLVSLSFFACKKSSTSAPKTKTELITQNSWKFDHASAAGIGDVSSFIPDCYKDNVTVFATGGTGTISEEANVCSPSTAGSFTWEFQSNETVLHLSAALFSGGTGDFNLESLTETNLVVSQTMTIAPYPSTTVTITFKH